MNKKFGFNKKTLTLSAFFFIGIALSLLSSFIVMNVGCGNIKLLECGYYAGFPVPYARVNQEPLQLRGKSFIVNPTLYYKYKFSPIKNDRSIAQGLLADGILITFFLLDSTLYSFNTLLFILNIFIWLLPAGFLIGVFF